MRWRRDWPLGVAVACFALGAGVVLRLSRSPDSDWVAGLVPAAPVLLVGAALGAWWLAERR